MKKTTTLKLYKIALIVSYKCKRNFELSLKMRKVKKEEQKNTKRRRIPLIYIDCNVSDCIYHPNLSTF